MYSEIGVYMGISSVLIFALKHGLWVLVKTASVRRLKRFPKIYVLRKNKKIITLIFSSENHHFYSCKSRCILHRHVLIVSHHKVPLCFTYIQILFNSKITEVCQKDLRNCYFSCSCAHILHFTVLTQCNSAF